MKKIYACICVLSCLVACLAASASHAGDDRIAFLNVRMVGGDLTLESVKVVDGRLKVPRTLHLGTGKLYCEVLDVSGKPIFETVVPDPSIHRFEYADDDGRLHSKTVIREDAFISIRIPYDPAARTLEVYRIDALPGRKELSKRASRLGSLRIEEGRSGHE